MGTGKTVIRLCAQFIFFTISCFGSIFFIICNSVKVQGNFVLNITCLSLLIAKHVFYRGSYTSGHFI